jgi:hypothetical protein
MIDRLQELKLEIHELDKNRNDQWLELQQEIHVTFSNSWLEILLNKNSDPSKNKNNPIFDAVRYATECLIEQTPLGKSKNKWAILFQHGLENLMPEIISIVLNRKNKAD